jgi:type I restriction enzyme S subunit
MSFPAYPAYKDSTISWLGRVPSHWNVFRLKHVCEVFPSNVDKHARDDEPPVRLCNYTDVYYNERITADIPFMHATASEEQIARFTLRGGDTIITKDSETADDIAVAAYVPDDLPGVVCGYHLSMVRPRGSTCGAFVKRLFDSIYAKARFAVAANGLTRVGLGQYAVDNIDLPFPPLGEQLAIAAFLDRETAKIDALVEEQKRLIELLKEKRQAVISQAVTKGLDPNVPMKDSGVAWLGEVPAHWEVKAIKWLSPVLRGASPRPIDDPKYFDDDGQYAWVRIADASASDGVLQETTQRLSALGSSLSVKLEPGSLFVSIAGTVGKPCIAGIKCCIHDGFVYFPRLSIDPMFLFRLFESGACYAGLGKMGTQLNLNTDTIGSIRVGLPPPSELSAILAFIDSETKRFDQLITEADAAMLLLIERRAALISAAVTGKIDVRGLAAQ